MKLHVIRVKKPCSRSHSSGVIRRTELKPCPFCGGKATFAGGNEIIPVVDDEGITVDAEWKYWPVRVVCKSCSASTSEFYAENDDQNYEDAGKAWNRRAEHE